MPGGPWAQYIDRSAPCLPARQVRVRWLLDVLGCFLVICRVFVFAGCWMQEGTLTWSLRRIFLPLPALRAQGPLQAHSFWTLHFCTIVRDDFLYRLFMYFRWIPISNLAPCWHYFPCVLHYFFEHLFYTDMSSILQGFLSILHPIGETLKNNCFYFTFA